MTAHVLRAALIVTVLALRAGFAQCYPPMPPFLFWSPSDANDVALQPAAPDDSVLVAYRADTADCQFIGLPGTSMAIWETYTAGDSVLLRAPHNCVPGACALIDTPSISVTVRAVVSVKSLFMLARVRDNAWIESPAHADSLTDVLSLYFDRRPASEANEAIECLIGECPKGTLGVSSTVLRIPLGTQTPGRTVVYEYYDEYRWEWRRELWTFDQLLVIYGIWIEYIDVSENERALEISIPPGIFLPPERIYVNGLRFAFTVGYDNTDTAGLSTSSLRWFRQDPEMLPTPQTHAWGDIYVNGLAPPAVNAVRPGRNATDYRALAHRGANTTVSVYSLDGTLVRTFTCGQVDLARVKRNWDGTDQNGKRVRAGRYVVKIDDWAGSRFSATIIN